MIGLTHQIGITPIDAAAIFKPAFVDLVLVEKPLESLVEQPRCRRSIGVKQVRANDRRPRGVAQRSLGDDALERIDRGE